MALTRNLSALALVLSSFVGAGHGAALPDVPVVDVAASDQLDLGPFALDVRRLFCGRVELVDPASARVLWIGDQAAFDTLRQLVAWLDARAPERTTEALLRATFELIQATPSSAEVELSRWLPAAPAVRVPRAAFEAAACDAAALVAHLAAVPPTAAF